MPKIPFASLDNTAYRLPDGLEQRLHSPALVIFMDQVQINLQRMLGYLGSCSRWRPHLKTTKMPFVWRELVLNGVRNFKCATLKEARCLAALLREMEIRDGDLLVAYPLVGPAVAGLSNLANEYPEVRFSVLVESEQACGEIAAEIGLFIDLNPGMNRTGIPLDQKPAILNLVKAAGSRLRGLHYYDGQLHQSDLDQRQQAAFRGYDQLMQLVRDLRGQEIVVGELITSGTPAFRCALAYPGFQTDELPVHRVSPGTVVFHDLRSELENPDLDLLPAACLFTRIISHPAPGIVTLDAGSKSIASEAEDPCAFVLGHPDWVAQTPSEEHLPLEIQSSAPPDRGTPVWLIPLHICPTVNLAEEVLILRGDDMRVEPVQARGHDLLDPA